MVVACGAAAGISATFNAPLTGLFFGFEIVLKEFSLDALAATSLAAVTADLISRAFFGSAPFFAAIPHDLTVHNDLTYLLIALLGITAGLIGVAFQKVLYRGEDAADALWRGRPEWLRPIAGGLLLGLVLLALPQMYGVGYPVMDRVLANQYLLWFVILLLVGKILAASLTMWIGGSGGVFAPSLFIGASAGMAFGTVAHHLFGPAVGPPVLYGVVAMGGVFAAAAQAPLTAIASVAEMTGNFTLTLPIMLACGIAAQLAKRITYGSIYTTKLLRRGIDIERPKALGALQALTVEEVMQPLDSPDGQRLFGVDREAARHPVIDGSGVGAAGRTGDPGPPAPGAVHRGGSRARPPPAHPLRTRRSARALARRQAARLADARRRAPSADHKPRLVRRRDRTRRGGGRVRRQEPRQPRSTRRARRYPDTRRWSCAILSDSPARGRRVGDIKWPPGSRRRGNPGPRDPRRPPGPGAQARRTSDRARARRADTPPPVCGTRRRGPALDHEVTRRSSPRWLTDQHRCMATDSASSSAPSQRARTRSSKAREPAAGASIHRRHNASRPTEHQPHERRSVAVAPLVPGKTTDASLSPNSRWTGTNRSRPIATSTASRTCRLRYHCADRPSPAITTTSRETRFSPITSSIVRYRRPDRRPTCVRRRKRRPRTHPRFQSYSRPGARSSLPRPGPGRHGLTPPLARA